MMQTATLPRPSWFRRKNRRRSADRAHPRHECRLEAVLTLLDSHIRLEGLVLDIASKGALFRPPQKYLLSRVGTPVRLSVSGTDILGTIVNTTPRGYGIQFRRELLEAELTV